MKSGAKTVKAYRDGLEPGRGRYGPFGGRYVAETLMPALEELDGAWRKWKRNAGFRAELDELLTNYAGRPTKLYRARRLSERLGATVVLKREDLLHTGAHKINNALGQALLARKMGKGRVIAETGAGQHGVASATAAALLGLKCVVYMGEEDMRRQAPNVFRMKLLGAELVGVKSGTKTLKDAMNEAMRDWITNVGDTYYIIGSAAGPAPYPALVRELQSVIGKETRAQVMKLMGRLPDAVVACVGGGSNAIGMFHPFAQDESVRLFGVEAAGEGIESGKHAATMSAGSTGVLHGMRTLLLQDEDGQVKETHSISAGLDYPGVGPEHAWLAASGRATYLAATDEEALAGFRMLAETEGILAALEPSHALGVLGKIVRMLKRKKPLVVVNLCGRGDKDLSTLMERLG